MVAADVRRVAGPNGAAVDERSDGAESSSPSPNGRSASPTRDSGNIALEMSDLANGTGDSPTVVEDGAVVGIHEITGVEDGQVSTQPLFLFQGGSLVSTGASPSF